MADFDQGDALEVLRQWELRRGPRSGLLELVVQSVCGTQAGADPWERGWVVGAHWGMRNR